MRSMLIGSILWLGFASAATAEGLSYSYIDVSYTSAELDDQSDATFGATDVEGDGYGLQGAIGLGNHFHMFVDYARQDFDDQDLEIEFTSLGLGTQWSLSPRVSASLRYAYVSGQANIGGVTGLNSDGDGLLAEIAFRGLLGSHFELEGSTRYMDVEGILDDTFFRLMGRIRFNDAFSLNLGADASNEQVSWLAGLRVNFGP